MSIDTRMKYNVSIEKSKHEGVTPDLSQLVSAELPMAVHLKRLKLPPPSDMDQAIFLEA